MGYVSMYKALSKMMQPKQPSSGQGKTQVYLAINGQQSGPFTKTELIQLVKNGTLTAQTYVWEAGMADWALAAQVPDVNKLLLLHTPKREEGGKRKEEGGKRKEESGKAVEHPLRQELISAMAQLGYKGAEMTQAIDALLASQPDISASQAIKILLHP